MLYHFKKTPVYINGMSLIISDAQLSREVGITSPYKLGDRVSVNYLNSSLPVGQLNLRYYLTGADILKQYIYSTDIQTITGNVAGLTFNQGYLTSYNISCSPNETIEVDAGITFFDDLSGVFTPQSPNNIGFNPLNLSNISIDNLAGYTQNIPGIITNASFSYSANISPVYKYVGTGSPPTRADRINIIDRKITADISCDNVSAQLPISGEKFGIILNLNNETHFRQTESFGCSGLINKKTLSLSANSVENNTISITQNHLNNFGGISGVIVNGNNTFEIVSNIDTHPFTSRDNSLRYVDNIKVGEIDCNNFNVVRYSTHDGISVTPPTNIVNDYLTVYSSNGNFTWPSKLSFSYQPITITGLSIYSGRAGTPMYISGTNFYNISEVYFGDSSVNFQIQNSTSIFTSVPYNGITDKVKVVSRRRGISGLSSAPFFHEPKITIFSPITGIWKDQIIIGGVNFTGVTSVKFNGINAHSYSLVSNSIISAQSPNTGSGGFAGGNISISTSGGNSISASLYSPHVQIYSFSGTSGLYGQNVQLNLTVDTGYMYPTGGGYKVNFGGVDQKFFVKSSGALTGLIPTGAVDGYIRLYKPDGVSTYSPKYEIFNVIGEPEIYNLSPLNSNNFRSYSFFPLTIYGKNLQYFNSSSSSVRMSGNNSTGVNIFTGNQLVTNTIGDSLLIPNAIFTGLYENVTLIVKNDYGQTSYQMGRVGDPIRKNQGMIIFLGGGNIFQQSPYSLTDGNFFGHNVLACSYRIPGGGGTYTEQTYVDFYNANNSPVDLSLASFVYSPSQGTNLTSINSGVISLFRNTNEVYNSNSIRLGLHNPIIQNYDGSTYHAPYLHPFGQTYTGITKIRFSTTGLTGNGIDYSENRLVVALTELYLW